MSLISKGFLYIVATPIGNLEDISQRAISILNSVDGILAEDTRHSRILLDKLNIRKEIFSLHEHNEPIEAEKYCRYILEEGKSLALISDAGTPLISDPGYLLVRKAQDLNIKVVPIPGPSAVITALSASGLPTDRFIFLGFLPAKKLARQKRLESLMHETSTLIFYEAPHRIIETLENMMEIFGETREAVLARELTKTFETIHRASLKDLFHFVNSDANQTRGEMVLLVAGVSLTAQEKEEASENISLENMQILKILAEELPPKKAAHLTGKITGISKQVLYNLLIKKP